MLNNTFLILILEIVYGLILFGVVLRIIWDTRSISKTLAYLLIVIFVPLFGIFFYFSFGINYRKRKTYTRKILTDNLLLEDFKTEINENKQWLETNKNSSVDFGQSLIKLLTNQSIDYCPVSVHNNIEILVNGESFFPLLIEKLKQAEKHIHIEFYIYEDDKIGNEIKEILIEKAKQGVEVRFIYDDFGSKSIRGKLVKQLRENHVKVYPFNKIKLIALANRLNYRNHRKIVVIDGKTSFIGGINISDKYINNQENQLYWRDTHLMIEGEASYSLQYVFLSDWNFCSREKIKISRNYFPKLEIEKLNFSPTQVIADGPDSKAHTLLISTIHAINLAKTDILITTPYYIPDDSLQQALVIASLSGIKVKLLVPKIGDSYFVSTASKAYFEELLNAGIEIYQYEKGFIHAKTFVIDGKISSVGTANLDIRSFDLNFEISSIIYDEKQALKLVKIFNDDLNHAKKIDVKNWKNRKKSVQFIERIFRLLSPFL